MYANQPLASNSTNGVAIQSLVAAAQRNLLSLDAMEGLIMLMKGPNGDHEEMSSSSPRVSWKLPLEDFDTSSVSSHGTEMTF